MSERTPLQNTIRELARQDGVDLDILDAADHPGTCRCPKCLKYWMSFMPAPPEGDSAEEWDNYHDELYAWSEVCPFTQEEIGEALDGPGGTEHTVRQ